MFKNYLKSAYQNIVRNKFYSFINILGLALGFTATIIILLYNQNELSYDKHNDNYERIYRLESHFTIAGKDNLYAITSFPLGPAFKVEYPEVEEFVRLNVGDGVLIRIGENEYYEDRLVWADSTLFDIFTHEFIYGTAKSALNEPNSVVINETMSKKYFGNNNPMGEIIKSSDNMVFKITGVIKDQPSNTHLKYSGLFFTNRYLAYFNSFDAGRFWNVTPYTYVLLKENASMDSVLAKFDAFYEKYMKSYGDQNNSNFKPMATPLADIHLTSELKNDQPTGNMSYVIIFSIVAGFILIIAAINYMNMATARSAKRAKEVGLRKVIGAVRSQLMRQFLSESVILSLIAFIIALGTVFLILPDFNELADKSLVFGLQSLDIIIGSFVIAIAIGLISGSYPSFYLSSFLPVKVLKGKIGVGKTGGLLRRVLVVFQFIISIFMIIGTIVISEQLSFLRNKDLGFNKENLLISTVQSDTSFLRKIPSFREELLQNPNINDLATSQGYPGNVNSILLMKVEQETLLSGSDSTAASSGGSQMVEERLNFFFMDYDFLNTYGIELLEGRNFDREMGTDILEGVIVNEALVKELGWSDNPIGKRIDLDFYADGSVTRSTKVIGVVKDFHYHSMHNAVEPITMILSPQASNFVSIRIGGKNKQETLQFIEDKWNEFGAINPFDYDFLETTMDDMYQAEDNIGRIFRIASLTSIFIALLGLFGLSSFIAEQRTQEIGIRKAVGASVGEILGLLYKEFIVLIIIAFFIASPLAWWVLNDWLTSNFVYSISMGWMIFLISGLIAMFIGMLTISYHIYSAANANPVDALKHE